MKDPLQTTPTPYEVLGVGLNAEKAEINRAYMLALRNRVPTNKAKAAYDALLQPNKRAIANLLQYDPQVLSRLNPCALDAESILLPHDRAATADAWERQLKAAFPDPQVTHTLAVFWYWWTLHEEQRIAALLEAGGNSPLVFSGNVKHALLRRTSLAARSDCQPGRNGSCRHTDCPWGDDCRSPAPPLDTMWRRVIGYWGTLAATADFWSGFHGVPGADGAEVRKQFLAELRNTVLDLSQRYAIALPAAQLPESYRMLDCALATELKTAEAMIEVGIKTRRGKVCCGVQMLQHLGMLETVREAVETALQKNPNSASLQSLRTAISPYSSVVVLLDNRKAAEALAAIEALPAEQQKSPEVARLKGQALHLRGKQQAEVGQIEEALESWESALQCGVSDLANNVRAEIVSTCHAQSLAWQRHQRNRAIAILETGVRLVADEKLRIMLGELLNQRAVEQFNKLHEQIQAERGGNRSGFCDDLRRLLADLKRAAQMGCKPAEENGKRVEELLNQLESGMLDVQDYRRWASEAIGEHPPNWGTAISNLQDAIRAAGARPPVVLYEELSVCLTNRGVREVNEALETRAAKMKELEAVMDRLSRGPAALQELLRQHDLRGLDLGNLASLGGCSMCPSHSTPYAIKLPNGSSAALCSECKEKLEGMMREAQEFSDAVILLLCKGEADLAEAVTLGPTNEHAQTSLREARRLLDDVPQARKKRAQKAVARWAKPFLPAAVPPAKRASSHKTPSAPAAASTPKQSRDPRHGAQAGSSIASDTEPENPEAPKRAPVATVKCKKCGGAIGTADTTCKHCGRTDYGPFVATLLMGVLLAALSILWAEHVLWRCLLGIPGALLLFASFGMFVEGIQIRAKVRGSTKVSNVAVDVSEQGVGEPTSGAAPSVPRGAPQR